MKGIRNCPAVRNVIDAKKQTILPHQEFARVIQIIGNKE